jgi:hypothetical protein
MISARGLERNIVAISGAVFLLALGENLWKRFIPKYLEALGAPVTAIGFFGTCQDFLDGVYQYPGGWIGDRYGRRRALMVFVGLATIGYGLYWWAPAWPFVFAGLAFVMAWSSMASPTLFAVVGDALPRERRALGFTVQSILRRIPIAVALTLGGLAIAARCSVGPRRPRPHLALAAITDRRSRVAIGAPPRADQRDVRLATMPTRSMAACLGRIIRTKACGRLLVLYAINVVGSTPRVRRARGVQGDAILSYLRPLVWPTASVGDPS